MKSFTAANVRAIIADAIKSGMGECSAIAHAEFCLEQAESQLGRDACKDARAEWNKAASE